MLNNKKCDGYVTLLKAIIQQAEKDSFIGYRIYEVNKQKDSSKLTYKDYKSAVSFLNSKECETYRAWIAEWEKLRNGKIKCSVIQKKQ